MWKQLLTIALVPESKETWCCEHHTSPWKVQADKKRFYCLWGGIYSSAFLSLLLYTIVGMVIAEQAWVASLSVEHSQSHLGALPNCQHSPEHWHGWAACSVLFAPRTSRLPSRCKTRSWLSSHTWHGSFCWACSFLGCCLTQLELEAASAHAKRSHGAVRASAPLPLGAQERIMSWNWHWAPGGQPRRAISMPNHRKRRWHMKWYWWIKCAPSAWVSVPYVTLPSCSSGRNGLKELFALTMAWQPPLVPALGIWMWRTREKTCKDL